MIIEEEIILRNHGGAVASNGERVIDPKIIIGLIPNVAVLPDSTIEFLSKHNIKQRLDKNRREFQIKADKNADKFSRNFENPLQDILATLVTNSTQR